MNPFDMGNMGAMLGGLQQRMADMKEQAAKTEVEGVAGGGLVRITSTLDNQITGVHIAEGAMGDRELLEDLVRAAASEAARKAKEGMAEQMQIAMGGLPIPPGLIPGM